MWSILPILLLFTLGFLLQKTKTFSEEAIGGLKAVVSHLALPALMFKAFSSLVVERSHLILVVAIFTVCLLMVVLGKLLARPLKMDSPYFSFMMGGFEMGMLGYALFLSLYGEENLGKLALLDLGQVLFVFFVLMALLLKEREPNYAKHKLVQHFLTSPVIIAIFLGILFSLFGAPLFTHPIFSSLSNLIDMLANLTTPLIALSIGYGIHIKRENILQSIKTILVRKLLLICFAVLLNRFLVTELLALPAIYRSALLLMFLTPPPFIITIYQKDKGGDQDTYVDTTLSLDTLFSIILVMVVSVLGW